ncbi:hypothetical protein COA01_23260 [Bacillus cereus]|uniref:hypothetical protein n=1 Tax=Bacillus cereus TaxID=1396 RepID=UPI000BFBFCC9|nr:hypothetical protein [Bacillus cereus]PGP18664.1 hypothetical protein COA01_23260 [Bacillus cereus]
MQLNLTYYTESSYFECFPEATEKDVRNYLETDEFLAMKHMEQETGKTVTKIRKVYIGEEYFEWLKKTRKKNTTENRLEFMSIQTDADVEKLWKKYNEKDWDVYVYAIPFSIIMVDNNSVSRNIIGVPKSTLNRLQNEISKRCVVPKTDVLLHPELIRGDDFFNEFEDEFEEASEKFFTSGEYNLKSKSPLFVPKEKHANLYFRFLPVSIKLENQAILTAKELKKEDKRNFSFTERFMSSISKEIQKQMKEPLTRVDGFEDPMIAMEIPEFVDEFVTRFAEMSDGKNIKFV